jgi:hypothetical protein
VQPAAGTPCCRPELPSTCNGAQISLNASIARTPVTIPGGFSDVPVYQGSNPPVQVGTQGLCGFQGYMWVSAAQEFQSQGSNPPVQVGILSRECGGLWRGAGRSGVW